VTGLIAFVPECPPGDSTFPGNHAHRARRLFGVAQVFNLLYRRLPVGRLWHPGTPAFWKPALQRVGNLRYAGSPFALNKYRGAGQ